MLDIVEMKKESDASDDLDERDRRGIWDIHLVVTRVDRDRDSIDIADVCKSQSAIVESSLRPEDLSDR